MQLTHLGHACVLVETESARVLVDPGTLASGFTELDNIDAVLVTHQHPDHLDVAALGELLARNPRARLIVDAGSAARVAALTDPELLEPGNRIMIGGLSVDALGGQHALVHPDIAMIANNALIFDDGAFYHPGDSFTPPERPVDVLAVPASGPWLKLGEAIDFVRAVAPRIATPIHEGALSSTHTHFSYLESLSPPGTAFVVATRGRSTVL